MSQTPSQACCNTPPIVSSGYKEKGEWITVDGMKTYATGPKSASHAILVVYDIFGFFPQTLQGADILATGDSTRQYRVFMPDFFEGDPADISWYPPDNEEKGKKLGAFFQNQAAPPKTVARVPKVVDEIKQKEPNLKTWASIGYCWGGKIINLTAQQNTPFKAAASAHPAMVDAADAPGVSIPIIMIPSDGEAQKDVDEWQKALKAPNEVHRADGQLHGFMAARGDLNDKSVVAAYEKSYKQVLEFFHNHLS